MWPKPQPQKITWERLQQIDAALTVRLELIRELKILPEQQQDSFRKKAEAVIREKAMAYLLG